MPDTVKRPSRGLGKVGDEAGIRDTSIEKLDKQNQEVGKEIRGAGKW